ncbi:BamA/TamA family outer membrane protein [Fibrella aquatica]|uniref:BamA/TamA family outer membrane protein n=1 Tax=Fibrella aquatica TaxID=3242487 RepID=UPI003522026E
MSFFTFVFSLWQFAAVPPPADSAVVVRSVKLVGNARTQDRIILREMDIRVDDTLRRGELAGKTAWDQRKIWNTNLFISVDVVAVEDTAAQPGYRPIDVTVTMKERWYIFVIPIFELADRNLNEWWYDRGRDLRRTNYGARLSWTNFTGRNDKLTALAQTGFTKKYILSYNRPYIDKAQRIGINADFFYATNREIAYRPFLDKWEYIRPEGLTSLRSRFISSLAVTQRNGFYNFHELEVSYTNNTIADTVASLNPDYFLDGRTRQQFLTLKYNYRYDRRDNVAYALQGTLLTGSLAHAGWLPKADMVQTDLLVGLSRYYPLSKRFFAAHTVRLRNVWSPRQPYYGIRGLGVGDDVIRGYELYVIEGNRYGVFRNNIRFRLFDVKKEWKWIPIRQFNTVPIAAYLSLIADAGYINSTIAEQYQSRLANRWLYSTGISLDVVTYYNMVFRFSTVMTAQRETGFFLNIQREL